LTNFGFQAASTVYSIASNIKIALGEDTVPYLHGWQSRRWQEYAGIQLDVPLTRGASRAANLKGDVAGILLPSSASARLPRTQFSQ